MSLLDKFRRKKEQEQLEAVQKEPAGSRMEKKSGGVKAEKTDKKKETKETNEVADSVAGPAKKASGYAPGVIVAPLVSEKAVKNEKEGTYTFIVDTTANKMMIREAIERMYGVRPERIRVMNMDGKYVQFGRRFGKRKDWKKAIVILRKGETISIHEGV